MAGARLADARRVTGMPVVVMGVSASGKTSVARALADALGRAFVEGDDLHPPASIARMKAGIALTDADRAPWLDAVAAAIAGAPDGRIVVSCSALRRAYRDRLRAAAPDAAFLLLDAPRDVLARRIAGRTGHFMPPSLLASQLDTLEPPDPDERALTLDATRPIAASVAAAREWLDTLTSRRPLPEREGPGVGRHGRSGEH